jgi:hypothetical protein
MNRHQLRQEILKALGETFSSLQRIAGSDGKFHIVVEVADPDRFRALGPHQREIASLGSGSPVTFAVREIELPGAVLTAYGKIGYRG